MCWYSKAFRGLIAMVCLTAIIVLPAFSSPSSVTDSGKRPVQNTPAPCDPEKEFDSILIQRQELRAKEAELKLLEKTIDENLNKLEGMDAVIRREMEQINRVSDIRVKRLIRLYSVMDSRSAARLMESLETDQAVEVLAGMKGEVSGAILANMEHGRASQLIRLLASYKGLRQ